MADAKSSTVTPELRELLAKKEEVAAKLNLAAAEVAKQRAEVAKINAELLRQDKAGSLRIRDVARW